MTRVRLNLVAQLSVIACLVACGSGKTPAGSSSPQLADANGLGSASNGGGAKATGVGGGANTAGVSNQGGTYGNAGNGTIGDGTSGADSQAGSNSGTGSSGSTTDGGTGNGRGDNGGAGNIGSGNAGADNGGTGSDSTGGDATIDVKITGGSGSSIDLGTGGGGSSIDMGTGGGYSLDVPTGGGKSVDMPTGGGRSVDMPTGGGNSVDMTTGGAPSIDLNTGGAPSVDIPPGCFLTTLTNVNVYVIVDATPTGADTEGNMLVGGNLTSSGYSIGACHDTGATHPCAAKDCTKYALVVGGNVTGVNVYGGKAASGGTITGSSDVDCGGITRASPTSLVPPVDFTTLAATVETLSTKLSQLPQTATATFSNSTLTLTCPANQAQSVFNITGAQFSGANVITISNSCATSTMVVNVSGTTIGKSGGGWTLPNNGPLCSTNQSPNDFCERIVWNMYQATSVTMRGFGLQGSLLAPLATLDGGGGDIDGQVIVDYLKGGLEYHPFYFAGCLLWPSAAST
jgi:choice-of-anchor A domain-containing protein